jgi:glycerol-3-phosphate dehydrogenase
MVRDLDRLTAGTFDLLVVGGGIYGLACAYDAAQRGLGVALVERDDFGSGSTFNHLRTIHGGLRYLQTLDLARARESVLERRTLARIAPQTIRPLQFVLPLAASLTKGPLAMRAGFMLDRLVACDRNRGVRASHRLPGGCVISRDEAARRFPSAAGQALAGAALWYDYQTIEPDRLTFLFALAAAEQGAILANHVEATDLLVSERPARRVVGARAVDRDTGRTLEIASRLVLNASGAAVDRLLAPLGLRTGIALLKAMNLVTRREAGAEALGTQARSGRHLFLVPWRGRALFGTWESPGTCGPEAGSVTTAEVSAFLSELNEAFPQLDLTRDEVTLVHRGIVPAAVHRDGRVSLEGHEQVRDHSTDAADPVEGLISVAGTKYTTARAVAERLVDRVLERLQHEGVSCRTATTPLPGAALEDVDLAIATAEREEGSTLSRETIAHLVAAYGSRYRQVLGDGRDQPGDWRTCVGERSPVIGAQLAWAVRREMALTLVDAVTRRTPLGALEYPGDAAAERAAAIVGAERGWSEKRRRDEIRALREFYALAGS